jgi:hypothetical protein
MMEQGRTTHKLRLLLKYAPQTTRYIHLRSRPGFTGSFVPLSSVRKTSCENEQRTTEYILPSMRKNDLPNYDKQIMRHDELIRPAISVPSHSLRQYVEYSYPHGIQRIINDKERPNTREEMQCDSVKRKRVKMMKRHKYRKRLRKQRALRKKLNK